MTSRRLIRSSTTRKRPSVSVTAATVISGFGMDGSIFRPLGPPPFQEAGLKAANGAQPVLGGAGVPDLVEFLQINPRHRRVVDVRDTVPGIGSHPVDDGPIVGDQVGR